MFWRLGYHTPTPIDTILDGDQFTLEDLFEEEELIQECKSHHKKLIEYLCQEEIVLQLLEHMLPVDIPSESDQNYLKKLKYAFLACEVFCCELWVVIDTLFRCREKLFSFMDRPEENTSILLANYFTRVVSVLLEKMGKEVSQKRVWANFIKTLEYLTHERDDFVPKLVAGVSSFPISELATKIVLAEGTTEWVVNTEMVSLLMDMMGVNHDPITQRNAAGTLSEIIQYSSWNAEAVSILTLLRHPNTPIHFFALMEQSLTALEEAKDDDAYANARSSLMCIMDTLLDTVRKTVPSLGGGESSLAFLGSAAAPAELGDNYNPFPPSRSSSRSSIDNQECAEFISVIAKQIPVLKRLLDAKPRHATMKLPSGTIPVVGVIPIMVLELTATLLRCQSEGIDRAVKDSEFLVAAIDMFFAFPHNNFLHSAVCDLVGAVLGAPAPIIQPTNTLMTIDELPTTVEPPMIPGVLRSLLCEQLLGSACKLTARIMKVTKDNTEQMAKTHLSTGNTGHVTQLANMIEVASSNDERVSGMLDGDDLWSKYVSGDLHAMNDELNKPLGGHRPVAMPLQSDDDDDLFNQLEFEDNEKGNQDEVGLKYFYERDFGTAGYGMVHDFGDANAQGFDAEFDMFTSEDPFGDRVSGLPDQDGFGEDVWQEKFIDDGEYNQQQSLSDAVAAMRLHAEQGAETVGVTVVDDTEEEQPKRYHRRAPDPPQTNTNAFGDVDDTVVVTGFDDSGDWDTPIDDGN